MMGNGPRVLMIGNRAHSEQILRHILESGANVVGVAGATGNLAKRQSGYTSFKSICETFEVPLIETDDIKEDRVRSFVKDADPTVGICCGWTQIIGPELLDVPDYGIGGLHMSPLPEGRGGAPVNWQLILDHDRAGVSLFEMKPEVDDGPLWGQTTVPIQDRDDIETLYNRLTRASCAVIDDVLNALRQGTFEVTEQDRSAATYFPQRVPEDGLVDWNWGTAFIDRWIRAQTHPYPGAFTMVNSQRLFLWEASVTNRQAPQYDPGQIVDIVDGDVLLVTAGDGVLRLERIQIAGEPPMWADEFASAASFTPGDEFGTADQFPDWLYTGIRDDSGGFNYETNLAVGSSGEVRAVCCSHVRERTVGITALLDGSKLLNRRIAVNGWVSVPISYTLSETGPHLLTVRFTEDRETIDVRRLKLYAY